MLPVLQLFPLVAKHRRLVPLHGHELGQHLGPQLPWLARLRLRHATILSFGTTVEHAWQTRPHCHNYILKWSRIG